MIDCVQVAFNTKQNSFIRFMLRTPFTGEIIRSGCLEDPITKKAIAGVCEMPMVPAAAGVMNFIMDHVLNDEEAERNRGLCLRYGLLSINPEYH